MARSMTSNYYYGILVPVSIVSVLLFFPKPMIFSDYIALVVYIACIILTLVMPRILRTILKRRFLRATYGAFPEFKMIVLNPILEELVFRNLLFGALSLAGIHVALTTLISTIPFVVLHKPKHWKLWVDYTVASILFSIGFIASGGSVWGAWILHSIANVLVLLRFLR